MPSTLPRRAVAMPHAHQAHGLPVAVTEHLRGLMVMDDAADPLTRQFVPDADGAEKQHVAWLQEDPIGDHAHSPVKGVVHRYPDRVLLKPLLTCPAYCRFCFRREDLDGPGARWSETEERTALAYVAAHPEISEVILTGGEPLMLPALVLARLAQGVDTIAHVRLLRIHTRAPVTDPALVDETRLRALAQAKRPLTVMVHVNHVAELAPATLEALARLRTAGALVLSQSVLLRGVNDSTTALRALFLGLLQAGVKPTYLHQLDLTPGTAHFQVPLAEARALLSSLRGTLPGPAMPMHVIDIPGGFGKVPADGDHVRRASDERWEVKDHFGTWHPYAAP